MAESLRQHVRSDEGLERGPRIKPSGRTPVADLGSWKIPEGLDPQVVLERYLTEPTTSQIASEYGLSRKALVKWLRETVPNEWKQAQVVRAFCRKDDADDEIERAADPHSLARAREMLKSGQWDLERLDSQNYGVKQEVTHKLDVVDLDQALTLQAQAILVRLCDTGVMSNTLPNGIKDLPEPIEGESSPVQVEGGGMVPDLKPDSP